MSSIEFSAPTVTDPSLQSWGGYASEVANEERSLALVDTPKPAAPSILTRITKFSADDTVKIMKVTRAILETVGEIFLKMVSSAILNDGGEAAGSLLKSFAKNINEAKKVAEVFVDAPGAKGAQHVFDGGPGFIAAMNETKAPAPFENPVNVKQALANVKNNYKRTEEFNKTIMAWHNMFKAPMWASSMISAVASLSKNPILQGAKGMLGTVAGGIDLVDALVFNLPGHLTWIYYHGAVAFDVTMEAFKAGFNHNPEASTMQAVKNGMDSAWATLTNREVVDNHLLPAVRFAAQTGLIVGLGLARASGGPALLLSVASLARPFAINTAQKLGCFVVESVIGAYRSWIKTGPKDPNPGLQPLVNVSSSQQQPLAAIDGNPALRGLLPASDAGKMIFAA